jgi:hypothetical protein
MAAPLTRSARTSAALGLVVLLAAACNHGAAARSDPTTTPAGSGPAPTPAGSGPAPTPAGSGPAPTTGGPLVAPKTTTTQDAQYFTDLARADPDLSSYVNHYGNVALKALITDGSAFCAFLARGGGIDNAMSSVVIGANSVKDQTHLPSSVATFNAIDAVALITLCPGEQKLLPPAQQSTIRSLDNSLGSPSG